MDRTLCVSSSPLAEKMASADDLKGTLTVEKKRRLDLQRAHNETGETGTRAPNRYNRSIFTNETRLPRDINAWTEKHITGLSINTVYESGTEPMDLLDRFPVQDHYEITEAYRFLIKERKEIVKLLIKHDFNELNAEFKNLQRDTASFLRQKNRYGRTWSLISGDIKKLKRGSDMRFWFHRYEGFRVQFLDSLYHMVVKRDLAEKRSESGEPVDPLCEYDFQVLFQAFASMCGLHTNHTWSEPSLLTKQLQMSSGEISGKANVLYCTELPDVPGSLQEILRVVAVCRVKRHFCGDIQQDKKTPRKLESDVSSTSSSSLPPHLKPSLIGQHGGQLLLYHQQSIMRNNAILGLVVQETKVSFTALEMTPEQFEAIQAGRLPSTKPKLTFTRPYDFMIKEDRHALFEPLLELGYRQCNE